MDIPFHDRDLWSTIITSACSVGLAVGSLGSAPFTRFGKKNCILINNILLMIGCGLTLVQMKEVVAAGRFIFGLTGGAFSVFVPSFINEITPTELKGPFGSATQLLITLGILISNLLGIPFPDCDKLDPKNKGCINKNAYEPGFIGDHYWRLVFALPILFAAIQCALLLFVFNFETPKFLKQNGRKAELNALMGKIYTADQVQSRIDSIVISEGNSSPGYGETLTSPKYRVATIIGCLLSMFQQLTGINIVMFYSSTIMSSAGLPANIITAIVGFVNCVSVFPTIIMFKKFGRKSLLWTLSFAIAASLIGLGVSLIINSDYQAPNENPTTQTLSIVFLILFIIFFEFSLGPLIWIYLSEIMTEKGLSLGVCIN
jgi:MFS family permease